MESILQNERECWLCKRTSNLHCHHIFYGTANRKNSEKYGFKVWLCGYHHNMSKYGVHFNKTLDLTIKKVCQAKFEETHSRAEFVRIIGKNYLDWE